MAKLKLNPEPTFKLKVGIPVPGRAFVPVEFTFKHRDRDQVVDWIETSREQKDVDSILDCAVAWELDDEYSAENIERLCKTYPGAAFAIVDTYLKELAPVRRGN